MEGIVRDGPAAAFVGFTASSQVLTPQSCKEQGALIKKGGGMPRIILRSHPVPPDVVVLSEVPDVVLCLCAQGEGAFLRIAP